MLILSKKTGSTTMRYLNLLFAAMILTNLSAANQSDLDQIKKTTNLQGLNFDDADLTKYDYFYRAYLDGTYLEGAYLYRVHLIKTCLKGAHLRLATLTKVYCQETIFIGADLRQTKLFETDLNDSDFTEADLSKADLHGSNVSKCNFTDANLSGANLKGTIFFVKTDREIKEGAIVKGADFKGALLDRKVIPYLIANGARNVVLLEE